MIRHSSLLINLSLFTGVDDVDTIGPEGMEKFCEDIGVEPENVSLASKYTCNWLYFINIGTCIFI